MDSYASTIANTVQKLNASTLMSDSDVIDVTEITEQTEVIDLSSLAPDVSILSLTKPVTIEAGDVVIWFGGGHYGDYHKVSWSFVETVTPP